MYSEIIMNANDLFVNYHNVLGADVPVNWRRVFAWSIAGSAVVGIVGYALDQVGLFFVGIVGTVGSVVGTIVSPSPSQREDNNVAKNIVVASPMPSQNFVASPINEVLRIGTAIENKIDSIQKGYIPLDGPRLADKLKSHARLGLQANYWQVRDQKAAIQKAVASIIAGNAPSKE